MTARLRREVGTGVIGRKACHKLAITLAVDVRESAK